MYICTAGTIYEITGWYQNRTCLTYVPYQFEDVDHFLLLTVFLLWCSPTGRSAIEFMLSCLSYKLVVSVDHEETRYGQGR